jgi:hypothetical protein
MWGANSGKQTAWDRYMAQVSAMDFDLFDVLDTIEAEGFERPIRSWHVPESYVECGMIDLATFLAREEGR